MATTGAQSMTLEEFRALPEGPPYYEYEQGELILVASPTPEHQDVIGILWNVLWQFVRHQ
jgi:Uma2 family endonuclease